MVASSTSASRRLAVSTDPGSLEPLKSRYLDQDEFLHLGSFVLPETLADLILEAEALKPRVHRSVVPGYKKSGSVSYFDIRGSAPSIHALYHDPDLLRFVSEVTGKPVLTCPEDDPHACALYYYSEAGDRVGYHYDSSHYAGLRFTLLVGLVDRGSSELVCHLFHKTRKREEQELRLRTTPGSLVLFNGDTIYHAVTPLGENEERIVLTLEYVTDRGMSRIRRLVSNLKDSIAYFGWKSVFRRSAT